MICRIHALRHGCEKSWRSFDLAGVGSPCQSAFAIGFAVQVRIPHKFRRGFAGVKQTCQGYNKAIPLARQPAKQTSFPNQLVSTTLVVLIPGVVVRHSPSQAAFAPINPSATLVVVPVAAARHGRIVLAAPEFFLRGPRRRVSAWSTGHHGRARVRRVCVTGCCLAPCCPTC